MLVFGIGTTLTHTSLRCSRGYCFSSVSTGFQVTELNTYVPFPSSTSPQLPNIHLSPGKRADGPIPTPRTPNPFPPPTRLGNRLTRATRRRGRDVLLQARGAGGWEGWD